MARKIKDTPVLDGYDAIRFNKIIKENEYKRVPLADYLRAKEAYRLFELIK